jgi:hypothetical protein
MRELKLRRFIRDKIVQHYEKFLMLEGLRVVWSASLENSCMFNMELLMD